MRTTKRPIQVKVLTGKESETVRKQRFQGSRACLAARIEEAHFSEAEIMAEVQASRAG